MHDAIALGVVAAEVAHPVPLLEQFDALGDRGEGLLAHHLEARHQ